MRLSGLVISCLVTAALFVSPASAAEETESFGTTTKNAMVSLELRNISVKDAIDALFKGTGYTYTIDPAVTGKVVEMKLQGITFKQALDALCEAAKLGYAIKDGAYTIVASQPTASQTSAGAQQPGAAQSGTGAIAPGQEATAQAAAGVDQGTGGQMPQDIGQPFYRDPLYRDYGTTRVLLPGHDPYIAAAGEQRYGRRSNISPMPQGYANSEVRRFLQGQDAIRNMGYPTPVY